MLTNYFPVRKTNENRSRVKQKIFWFIILCLLLIPGSVFAHPHVFIDNTITIVFDQKGLAGIKAKWVFDEMFSSMIIHDYDGNKDGAFNVAEIKKIKNGAFSNLKNFHYFTYIKIDGKKFEVKFVRDFSSSLDNNRVIYTFFIPCHVLASSSQKEIKISIYDNTYYVDVALAGKNPVHFEHTSHIDCQHKIVDNTKNPYYYGQIFPQEIILKFRKKSE